MRALLRIDALLPLLWPDCGASVSLERVAGTPTASVFLRGDEAPAAECGAPSLAAALDALGAHLCDVARSRAAELLAATGDAHVRADHAARLAECERELTAVTRDRDEFRGLAGARLDALCHLGAGRPVPAQTRAAVGMFAHDPLDAIASRLADLAATRSELTATARRCDVLRAALAALAAGRPVDHVAAEAAGADTHAIDAIAERLARVDAQPAQGDARGGAGVPRAIVDAELAHMDFVARCSDSEAIRNAVAHLAARLRDSIARSGERIADECEQPGERVAEVVATGQLEMIGGGLRLRGFDGATVVSFRHARELAGVAGLDGQQVSLCVRRLGEGHGRSIVRASGEGEGP